MKCRVTAALYSIAVLALPVSFVPVFGQAPSNVTVYATGLLGLVV